MTDWGDAMLNEKARPRTFPTAPGGGASGPTPDLAVVVATEIGPEPPPEEPPAPAVPRPDPTDVPLTEHDKGDRIIPPEGGG